MSSLFHIHKTWECLSRLPNNIKGCILVASRHFICIWTDPLEVLSLENSACLNSVCGAPAHYQETSRAWTFRHSPVTFEASPSCCMSHTIMIWTDPLKISHWTAPGSGGPARYMARYADSPSLHHFITETLVFMPLISRIPYRIRGNLFFLWRPLITTLLNSVERESWPAPLQPHLHLPTFLPSTTSQNCSSHIEESFSCCK
jgi:hypothetical protein